MFDRFAILISDRGEFIRVVLFHERGPDTLDFDREVFEMVLDIGAAVLTGAATLGVISIPALDGSDTKVSSHEMN